jgi:hypothetical protein
MVIIVNMEVIANLVGVFVKEITQQSIPTQITPTDKMNRSFAHKTRRVLYFFTEPNFDIKSFSYGSYFFFRVSSKYIHSFSSSPDIPKLKTGILNFSANFIAVAVPPLIWPFSVQQTRN